MKKRRILFSLFLIGAIIGCSNGRFTEFKAYTEKTEVRTRAGGTGFIILKLEIPGRQYIYGNPKGPGTGKPTVITIKGGPHLTFGTPRFLPPKKHVTSYEKEFVWMYTDSTRVLIPFSADKNITPGNYPVEISCDVLLCSDIACTPKNITVESLIKIVAEGGNADIFPRDELDKFSIIPGQEQTGISLPDRQAGAKNIGYFFNPRFFSTADVTGILQALLFGILAGLLLNFMPCVLPVVSLKVMGFVRHAHGSRKNILYFSLLFSLGILTSFAVLASLAAFPGYHWGSLFQHRLFLIAMIALVFAMSMSMFGVFTLTIPSIASKAVNEQANPFIDSYVKGLLATLLATPCSGPFLGGTLAYAFTQKPPVIFLIFMSIGLGMSLPYILTAANPGFLRFLPKPGTWMITLEHIMAFLLAGTSVYLLGILRQDLVLPALWFLLIFSLGLWQYGRYGSADRPRRSRVAALIILIAITAGGYLGVFHFFPKESTLPEKQSVQEYSMARLAGSRDAGRISAVIFTADWCPNCTLVEKTSLNTRKVIRTSREYGVDYYIADITRENPEAQLLLEALGSRSIPFLAFFPPGKMFNEPICLRDIYSEGDVLQAIREASGKNTIQGKNP